MKILIQNGKVINADSIKSVDIRCADGKIIEIAGHLESQSGERTIDARGQYIFPGGIDPHVHMQLRTHFGTSSDDFYSGSIAALMGGTTTIIDFVTPNKGQSLIKAIAERKKEALKSIIDYSFHVSPIEWRKNMANEIRACVEKEGLKSFKAYMAYKDSIGLEDDKLLKVMEAIADVNGLLAVHCELGDDIERLRNQFGKEGRLSPKYHALTRPPEVEAAAVKKLMAFVEQTNCSVYVVHVSSEKSLGHIVEARKKGLPVYAETCPQYLLLDDSLYDQEFKNAVKYIMSPPLKKRSDNKALWNAINSGYIQSIGTDHCPFTFEQKTKGINDFRLIPNGAGGVEHRLSLLYTYGVLEKKISLQQFVNLISSSPAKIFGLYPGKGKIDIGSDADLVIWNPDFESRISSKNHHMNCDMNIYEDFKIKGKAQWVIQNANILVENGVLNIADHWGKFLQTKAPVS